MEQSEGFLNEFGLEIDSVIEMSRLKYLKMAYIRLPARFCSLHSKSVNDS